LASKIWQGQVDRAITLLKMATALDTTLAEAYDLLADCYKEKGDHAFQIACLEKEIGIPGRQYYSAYRQLAEHFFANRQFDKYCSLFRSAPAGMKEAVIGGANYAFNDGPKITLDFETAQVQLQKLIGSNSKSNSLIYAHLAFLAYNRKDTARAIGWLEQALKRDAENAAVWYSLASLYESKGKNDEALKLYQKMLMVQPENAELHYSIGYILHKMGREKEARESFRTVNDLEPELAADSYEYARRNFITGATSEYCLPWLKKAASLGHPAAQDSLRKRNIPW